jgi:hypothetical protein
MNDYAEANSALIDAIISRALWDHRCGESVAGCAAYRLVTALGESHRRLLCAPRFGLTKFRVKVAPSGRRVGVSAIRPRRARCVA